MTELHDFITVRPEELIDALEDGPRGGQFNPNPEEVQELLAQVHADMGIATLRGRAITTSYLGNSLRLNDLRRAAPSFVITS